MLDTGGKRDVDVQKVAFSSFLSSSRSPRVSNTLLHSFVAIYHRKRAFGKRDFLFMQAVSPCEQSLVSLSALSAALQRTYTLCELQKVTKGKKERGEQQNRNAKRGEEKRKGKNIDDNDGRERLSTR